VSCVELHVPKSDTDDNRPGYESLTNNVPTPLMKLQDHSWKPDTADFVNITVLGEYIQGIAKTAGVADSFKWDTRVVALEKTNGKWHIDSVTLERLNDGSLRRTTDHEVCFQESLLEKDFNQYQIFDAVVVASGHYHGCKIPAIPNLPALKSTFPNRISHSKSYRRATGFEGKNVLLVGGGVSSTDIAKDISKVANNIVQVTRNGTYDLPAGMLPENARRVGPIQSFSFENPGRELRDDEVLPAVVHFQDGTSLSGFHRIIFCTGYHCALPFLKSFHADSVKPADADERLLVTDGLMVHNLHKDIFYIPDPTLAFVGVPYHIATFSLFEFQAVAVAAVFSGRTALPVQEDRRAEYDERVTTKGIGREFHSLGANDGEVNYVRDLVGWINEGREPAERVRGHSEAWLAKHADMLVKRKILFEMKDEEAKDIQKSAEEKKLLEQQREATSAREAQEREEEKKLLEQQRESVSAREVQEREEERKLLAEQREATAANPFEGRLAESIKA
jgi:hypothetical protein